MRVAHIIPKQDEIQKDILFCKYAPDIEFIRDWGRLVNEVKYNVDFIYAGSISVLPQALQLKRMFFRPVVCWVWDIPYNWRTWSTDERCLEANKHRDQQNKDRAAMLQQCDLVISASKWTQKVLKDEYNVDSKQIYFYIDVEGIDKVASSPKENQAIQISRFFWNKRFEDSILAFRHMPNYKLILMGTGLKSEYGKWIQGLATPNIQFNNNPSRTSVIHQLKRSKLLMSPTVFEGWGITPIEAIHCGTLPILSDLPVFREVYGDDAVYHKPTYCDLIHRAVEAYMTEDGLIEERLQSLKKRIVEFTPQKFAQRWRKLINENLPSITL